MLSEVFWMGLTTGVIGMILALCRMAYKSKCSHLECMGCIKLDRNTEGELKGDALELTRNESEDVKEESPSKKTTMGAFSEANPMKQLRLFAP